MSELSTFIAQLRSAADQLSGEPVDGPCGPDCACLVTDGRAEPPVAPSLVTLRSTPESVPVDVPVACTLEPAAMANRLGDWARVLTTVTSRTAIDGGLRIEFGPAVDLGDLGRLIGAEQHCCAFFQFSLNVDASGTVLEVRAPALAADMIADVFGHSA